MVNDSDALWAYLSVYCFFGLTGFLIETGNHEDLIKKINQVFDQPAVASNMGSKGKEIIQKKFNWDNIAKKFVLILNQNL